MKLVVATFLSLDGVMQSPGAPDEDRSGGFEHGGWQFPYADEELTGMVSERMEGAEALLLGRRTYEIFAAHWPKADPADPIAAKLNAMPKYVVSTTLESVEWHNSTLVTADVPARIAELKRRPGSEMLVWGSSTLLATLMAHDLVDEYRLFVYPVVLGAGKRLFAAGSTPAALRLVDSKPTGSGMVALTYRPAGRPSYGSFG